MKERTRSKNTLLDRKEYLTFARTKNSTTNHFKHFQASRIRIMYFCKTDNEDNSYLLLSLLLEYLSRATALT